MSFQLIPISSTTTTTTSEYSLQQQMMPLSLQYEEKDRKAVDEKELKESDKKTQSQLQERINVYSNSSQHEEKERKAVDEKERKERDEETPSQRKNRISIFQNAPGTRFGKASAIQMRYRDWLMKKEYFIKYQGKKIVFTLESLLKVIKPFLKQFGNDSNNHYLFGSEANPCRPFDPEFVCTDIDYNLDLTDQFCLSMEDLKRFMVKLVKDLDGRGLPDYIIEKFFFKKIDLRFAGVAIFNIAGIELKFSYREKKSKDDRLAVTSFDSWKLYDNGILSVTNTYYKAKAFKHYYNCSLKRDALFLNVDDDRLKNFIGRFTMLISRGVNIHFTNTSKVREVFIKNIVSFHKESDNKAESSVEHTIELLARNVFVHYRENRISATDDLAELVNFLNMINFISQQPIKDPALCRQAVKLLSEAWKKSGVIKHHKWNCWHENPLQFLDFFEKSPELVNDFIHFLTAAIFIKFALNNSSKITVWMHNWMKITEEAAHFHPFNHNSFSFVNRSGTRCYLPLILNKNFFSPARIVSELLNSLPRFKKENIDLFNHFDFLFQMFQLNPVYLTDHNKMLIDLAAALQSESVAKSFGYDKKKSYRIDPALLAIRLSLKKYKVPIDQILDENNPLKKFIKPEKSYQFTNDERKMLKNYLDSLSNNKKDSFKYKVIQALPDIIVELSTSHPFEAIKFYQAAQQLGLLPLYRQKFLPKLVLNFLRSYQEMKEKSEFTDLILRISNECLKNNCIFNQDYFDHASVFFDFLLSSSQIQYLKAVESRIEMWINHKSFTPNAGVSLIHRILLFMNNKQNNNKKNVIYLKIINRLLSNQKVMEILSKEDGVKDLIDKTQYSLSVNKDSNDNYNAISDLFITLLEGGYLKYLLVKPVAMPKLSTIEQEQKILRIVSLMPEGVNWGDQLENILKICRKTILSKNTVNTVGSRALQNLLKENPKLVLENIYQWIADVLKNNPKNITLTKKSIQSLTILGEQARLKMFSELSSKSMRVLVIQEFTELAKKDFEDRDWFKSFKSTINSKESFDVSKDCKETFEKLKAIKEQEGTEVQLQQYTHDISKTICQRIAKDDNLSLKDKVVQAVLETIRGIHALSQKSRTEKISKIARGLIYSLKISNLVSSEILKGLFSANKHQRLQITISKLAIDLLYSETQQEEQTIAIFQKINNAFDKLAPFFKENPKAQAEIIDSIKEILSRLLLRNSSEKMIAVLFNLYQKFVKNDTTLLKLFAEAIVSLPTKSEQTRKIASEILTSNNEDLPFLGLKINGLSPEKLIEFLSTFPKEMSANLQLYLTDSIRRYLQEFRTVATLSQQLAISEKLLQLITALSSDETEHCFSNFVAQLIENLRETRLSNGSQNNRLEIMSSFLKVVLDKKVFANHWEVILEEALHYELTEDFEKLLSDEQIQKISTSLIPKLARNDSFLNGSEKTSKGQELRVNLRRFLYVSRKIDTYIAIYSTPQNFNELQMSIKHLMTNMNFLSDRILSSSDVLLAIINHALRSNSEDHLKLIPDLLNFIFKRQLPNSLRDSYAFLDKVMMKFVSQFPQTVTQLESLILPLSADLFPNLIRLLQKSFEIRFDKLLEQIKPSKSVEKRQRKYQEKQDEIIYMGAAAQPVLKTEVVNAINEMLEIYNNYIPKRLSEFLIDLQSWSMSNVSLEKIQKFAASTENPDADSIYLAQILLIRAAFEQEESFKKSLILLSNAIECIKQISTEQTQLENRLENLFLEFHQQLIKKFFYVTSQTLSNIVSNQEVITANELMFAYLDWIANQPDFYQYLDSLVKLSFGVATVLDLQESKNIIDFEDDSIQIVLNTPNNAIFANLKQLISQSVPTNVNIFRNQFSILFYAFFELPLEMLTLYAYSSHKKNRGLKETSILCKWVFNGVNQIRMRRYKHALWRIIQITSENFYYRKIFDAMTRIYRKEGNSPKLFNDLTAVFRDMSSKDINVQHAMINFFNQIQESPESTDENSYKVENETSYSNRENKNIYRSENKVSSTTENKASFMPENHVSFREEDKKMMFVSLNAASNAREINNTTTTITAATTTTTTTTAITKVDKTKRQKKRARQKANKLS